MLWAWVAIERRVTEPLVDLQTLLRRGMAATNLATLLLGFSLTAFFVLVPGFVQTAPEAGGYGFGASPSEAGLLLLPFSAAMILAGPLGGALGTRHGRAVPLRIGLALGAVALALLAGLHDEPWMVAAWLPLMGCGMAFALAAIGALVLDNSRPHETGVASAMNSIMRTAGAAVGAQIAAAIVSARTRRAAPASRSRTATRSRSPWRPRGWPRRSASRSCCSAPARPARAPVAAARAGAAETGGGRRPAALRRPGRARSRLVAVRRVMRTYVR